MSGPSLQWFSLGGRRIIPVLASVTLLVGYLSVWQLPSQLTAEYSSLSRALDSYCATPPAATAQQNAAQLVQQASFKTVHELKHPQEPQYLTASGLMDAVASGRLKLDPTKISKIMHQSIGPQMDEFSATLRRSWVRDYPDFSHILWSDMDNEYLWARFLPQYLDGYRALGNPILKADLTRNAYMYVFGGLYGDVDMESLYPVPEIMNYVHNESNTDSVAVFGSMGHDWNFPHYIPNAWFASTPKHPFWLLPIEQGINPPVRGDRGAGTPEEHTGPVALKECIHRWDNATDYSPTKRLEVLPPCYIYPYDWAHTDDATRKLCENNKHHRQENQVFDRQACIDFWQEKCDPNPPVITYWAHSW